MSAIAGIWRFDGPGDVSDQCARMLRAQSTFGPDAHDQSGSECLALGRCLMRLLPEDVADRQPVAIGQRQLVADVRLDNRADLIRQLALPAEQSRSAADSSLLFAALQRWGHDVFEHLVGDYAFAWWDGADRQLLLARDPLGQRPLHFHRSARIMAFASMPRGLHALPEVPYAPDMTRFIHRLAQVPPFDSRTYFEGIERVEPGHVLLVRSEGVRTWRHWQPQRRILRLRQPQEYAEALCAVLDSAVAAQLRGTGDVAAHLSGGRDSTSVVASAARLQAARGRRVIGFTAAPTAGFAENTGNGCFVDETRHAAAVAALYANIEHVVLRPTAHDPLQEMERSFQLYDKPLLAPPNVGWGHAILDQTRRRGISVLLGGDIGNATISYSGVELLSEVAARGELLRWLREARALVHKQSRSWRGLLVSTLSPWLPLSLLNQLDRSDRAMALSPHGAMALRALLAKQPPSQRRAQRRLRANSWDLRLQRLQQCDRGNESKGMLGGWRVERRDPTMDRRVVEFCLSVPTEEFLRDGVPSALLRRAMADRLPRLVLDERRRGLQAADWHVGMVAKRGVVRAELARLAACAPIAANLDVARLHAAVDDWPQDGWARPRVVKFYRSTLPSVLSAGHFVRRVLEGAGAAGSRAR